MIKSNDILNKQMENIQMRHDSLHISMRNSLTRGGYRCSLTFDFWANAKDNTLEYDYGLFKMSKSKPYNNITEYECKFS